MGAGGPDKGGNRPDQLDSHREGSVNRARQGVVPDVTPEQPIIGTVPPPISPATPRSESPPSSASTITPISSESNPHIPVLPLRSALRTRPPRPPTILIPGLGSGSASQWTQRQGNSFWQPDSRLQPPELRVGRGPPPPRPPRPDFVAPLRPLGLQGDRQGSSGQEQASTQQNLPKDGEGKPSISPEDGGTRISDAGSGASTQVSPLVIPDFPLPAVPSTPSPPMRRGANLGPPPSARKGTPMYYSQTSHVSPIPEELPEGHSSYASSRGIPSSWGDGPPSYYTEAGNEEVSGTKASSVLPGGQEPSLTAEPQDGAGYRNLSRRSKGSSKEVTGSQILGYQEAYSPAAPSPISAVNSDTSNSRLWPAGGVSDTGSPVDQQVNYPPDPNGPRPRYLAPPPGASPASMNPTSPAINTPLSPFSDPYSPPGSKAKYSHGTPELAGPFSSKATISPLSPISPSIGGKEQKRPAGLNLTGAKDGEIRSSQSSLPELIRRATKLASSLDRSRTASRVGALDGIRRHEKSARGDDSNSISDILAAFPSPSSSTPPGERQSQRRPSPIGKSSLSNVHGRTDHPRRRADPEKKHQRRRCCGMPLWVFALLCLVLLLLIAAAVIIPVTLLVLPKQRQDKTPTLASCIQDFPCVNGGTNLLIQKSCRCVCSNGFTGSTCSATADRGCITADLKAEQSGIIYRNATMGSGIPRLLFQAFPNFSIPLETSSLLSLFSSMNLSCADENQLITFNGRTRRRSLPLQFAMPKLLNPNERPEGGPSVLSPHTATPALPLAPTLLPRGDAPPSPAEVAFFGGDSNTDVVTSNEIILAGPTSVTVPSPSSTANSPEKSPSASALPPVPQKAFDFARVAVLFILQEASLNDAMVARDRLSEALKSAQMYDSIPVNAGQSIEVDLGKMTFSFGNGSVFGGKVMDE